VFCKNSSAIGIDFHLPNGLDFSGALESQFESADPGEEAA
jgi:hypothetical protein